jgi:CheY-like chemotaxis protein
MPIERRLAPRSLCGLEVQRERMRGSLEGPQWTVREAENGREALKRIQESKPDVILLDLMMPEMDG